MSSKAVDPAVGMDPVKVLSEYLERQEERERALPGQLANAFKDAQASLTADGRTLNLPLRQPVLLLGYDRARVRALLRANVPDVFIGDMSQLNGGLGYPLPTASGDEIKTIAEVYVIYNPSGAADPAPSVATWVERNAGD